MTAALEKVTELRPRADWSEPDADSALVVHPSLPVNSVKELIALAKKQPGQLFYSTQIPACLWFLAKDKSNGIARDRKLRDRRGEVLFIDARKLGFMVDRTRKEFSDADVAQITDTYHAWRLG